MTNSVLTQHVTLPIRGRKQTVMVDRIVCLDGDGNYTNITLRDGFRVLVARTLKDYENLLDSQMFVRVHKSCIVNLNFVRHIDLVHACEVELTNGRQVKVARRRIVAFAQQLSVAGSGGVG